MMHSWPPYAVAASLLFALCDVLYHFKKSNKVVEDHQANLYKIAISRVVSKEVLLGYRCTVALGSVGLVSFHVQEFGLKEFKYFTLWNYSLLTVYFLCSSVVTCMHWMHPKECLKSRRLGKLSYFLVAIFHIVSTTIWIVDIVAWGLLWPMIKHVHRNDPVQLALSTRKMFSLYSYVEHGVNIPIMLIELAICNITLEDRMLGYVGIWGLTYAAFAIAFFFVTNIWIYPIINWTKTWSPLVYLGVHFAHRGVFLWFGFLKNQMDLILERYKLVSLQQERSKKQS